MSANPLEHMMPLRVYYEDTDAGGVVYYANYLRYAERGRSEYLRNMGYECSQIAHEHGVLLVVRHAEIDYRASARLDDALTVDTRLIDLGKASFTMQQDIKRDGATLVSMKILLACVNPQGRVARLPATFYKSLEERVSA